MSAYEVIERNPDGCSATVILDKESKRPSSSERALTLLQAFAGSRPVLGLSELVAKTGVPKSTAHRLLAALVGSGYVKRVGDRYGLAERAFILGNGLWACRPGGLRERSIPFMIELSHQTKGIAHLAIPDGDSVVYIEKIFVHDCPPSPTSVGSRRPAHCTALGKTLLAHSTESALPPSLSSQLRRFTPHTRATVDTLARDLDHVRRAGVATDFQEFRMGVCCVAVPILDRGRGPAVGALSICTTPDRIDVRRFSAYLLRAAEAIGRTAPVGVVGP